MEQNKKQSFAFRAFKRIVAPVWHSGLKNLTKKIIIKLSKYCNLSVLDLSTTHPVLPDNTVTSIVNFKFRNLQPFPILFEDSPCLRINLVTDSLDSRYLLGGVATALIIATELANHCDAPLRIITRTAVANPSDFQKIICLNGLTKPKAISFYTDYDRNIDGKKDFRLEISNKDVFIATSWWSAAAIDKLLLTKRFFYVIQEVEQFFYPHGEDHYLCSQIMNRPTIDFIINSHYLFDYFKEHMPNITDNGVFFEPAFSKDLYRVASIVKKSKYNLFFYARPNHPRNLFHYGVDILDAALERGVIDLSDWEIYFAGHDMSPIVFSNGYAPKIMGLMDWEQYADFLKNIDLAVSLMYTPHPSYPPFDVACSGGVVVSNTYQNKTEIRECKNILLSDLDEQSFLETLEKGIALAKDIELRRKNFEESTILRSWSDSLKEVIPFMEARCKSVLFDE